MVWRKTLNQGCKVETRWQHNWSWSCREFA